MNCVKCGAAVPEGAAFCPNCGASAQPAAQPSPQPPTKKSNKLLGCLGIGGGIIVLLIIVGSLAPGTKKDSPESNVSNPEDLPIAVTATELFQAYQYNEASAQSYFGDRKLLVSGAVDKVTLDFMDNPVVGLRTPNQFLSAQAKLADDAKDEAGSFGPGDQVKLLCENVSEVVGTPMLKDCRTAPPGTKSQPVQWSKK